MYEVDIAHGVNELRQKLLNLASPWYLHSVVPMERPDDDAAPWFMIICRLGKQEATLTTPAEAHPEDFKRW
jgi:hypothetical protein